MSRQDPSNNEQPSFNPGPLSPQTLNPNGNSRQGTKESRNTSRNENSTSRNDPSTSFNGSRKDPSASFNGSRNDPSTSRNGSRNDPSTSRNGSRNDPSTSRNGSRNDPSTSFNGSRNDPSTSRNVSRNDPSTSRNESRNDPSTSRNVSRNDPSNSRNVSRNDPSTSRNVSRNDPSNSRQSSLESYNTATKRADKKATNSVYLEEDARFYSVKNTIKQRDEFWEEQRRNAERLPLRFWRKTHLGTLERLHKLVDMCESKMDLEDLLNNLNRIVLQARKMFDDATDQARSKQGYCKEVQRQVKLARELAQARTAKADKMSEDLNNIRLLAKKREVEFNELKGNNRGNLERLLVSDANAAKTLEKFEFEMEQAAQGAMRSDPEYRHLISTLLITATARTVQIEEANAAFEGRRTIMNNLKDNMKGIIAERNYEDVERRTYGHMARRLEETVGETKTAMGEQFEKIISQMEGKSEVLRHVLYRMGNERLALIFSQRQSQMDVFNTLIGENEHLMNIKDLIEEFVGRPEFFEFRQHLKDQAHNMLRNRIDTARMARSMEEDPELTPITLADIPPIKVNIANHLENADEDFEVSDPAKITLLEKDVNFSNLWRTHIARQEVLRDLLDRLEITGLMVKTNIDAQIIKISHRTEVSDTSPMPFSIAGLTNTGFDKDEDDELYVGGLESAAEDEWCLKTFDEEELREFVGPAIFNKGWIIE